jgi:hypothetical protein
MTTTVPSKAATLQAIRATRAALRDVEAAMRCGDYVAAAVAAERAAGSASLVSSDAEDRLAAACPERASWSRRRA